MHQLVNKNFDSIKMHGTTVGGKTEKSTSINITFPFSLFSCHRPYMYNFTVVLSNTILKLWGPAWKMMFSILHSLPAL